MQKFARLIVGAVVLLLLCLLSYRAYVKHESPPAPTLDAPQSSAVVWSNSRRIMLGYQSYPDELSRQFRSLVERRAAADDRELIEFVRKIIDPPSQSKMIKMSRPLVVTPQSKNIDDILLHKTGGFFVEAGALDGERSSNSIFFEKERNWMGLLVEPDPYFYTQLMGKNRNSWSINACLSVNEHVTELEFQESSGGHGKLLPQKKSATSRKVPCFPLSTLLTAVNVSRVDFFSLDVEGFELDVLMTVPMDQFDIRSLAVEYLHGNEGKLTQFMTSVGYKVVSRLHEHRPEIALYVDDLIFAKNESRR